MKAKSKTRLERLTLTGRVIRADGTVEELGILAEKKFKEPLLSKIKKLITNIKGE